MADVTSSEEFLHALRDVFARNRAVDWPRVGVVLAVLVGAIVALVLWIRRSRAQRTAVRQIESVAAGADLRGEDLDQLRAIADRAELPLVSVMTELPAFERATALILANEKPTPQPAPGSLFERVGRLRHALGFAPAPSHQWLRSSRELIAGDAVALGDVRGQVAEVNEASFAVDLPARDVPARDTTVTLTLIRADDSRYRARARVIDVAAASADLRRVYFAHDEQPERHQHRKYVRARVQGPITVQVGGGRGVQSHSLTGSLWDVSAGGLAFELPATLDGPLVAGAEIICSFHFGEDASFASLPAMVTAAEVSGNDATIQHVRVAFTGLTTAEQDRLAAAVMRQPRRPPPRA